MFLKRLGYDCTGLLWLQEEIETQLCLWTLWNIERKLNEGEDEIAELKEALEECNARGEGGSCCLCKATLTENP